MEEWRNEDRARAYFGYTTYYIVLDCHAPPKQVRRGVEVVKLLSKTTEAEAEAEAEVESRSRPMNPLPRPLGPIRPVSGPQLSHPQQSSGNAHLGSVLQAFMGGSCLTSLSLPVRGGSPGLVVRS
jgi:hypothetical protein